MGGLAATPYLRRLSAGAYMRSLWEGDVHGRGVTLFGWTGGEGRSRRRDGRAEEH